MIRRVKAQGEEMQSKARSCTWVHEQKAQPWILYRQGGEFEWKDLGIGGKTVIRAASAQPFEEKDCGIFSVYTVV